MTQPSVHTQVNRRLTPTRSASSPVTGITAGRRDPRAGPPPPTRPKACRTVPASRPNRTYAIITIGADGSIPERRITIDGPGLQQPERLGGKPVRPPSHTLTPAPHRFQEVLGGPGAHRRRPPRSTHQRPRTCRAPTTRPVAIKLAAYREDDGVRQRHHPDRSSRAP